MNISNIYEKIKNPLDDDNLMKSLINMYSQSLDKDDFYKVLVNKKVESNSLQKDIDEFYCLMFNEWKNSIIEMSFKQFSNLVKNENYKKNFSKMREFLEKLPDVKTKEEIGEIIFGNYKGKDFEVSEMLQTYYWSKSDNSDWEYVYYNYIKLKRNSNIKIENLFIINIEQSSIYKFASLFVNKCKNYDLEYYFKFNKIGNRIDSIVIGANTSNLANYLRIFDEIRRKNPEILAKMNKAPILTGRLSSWLGYGSNLSNEKEFEFYNTRALVIKESMEKCIAQYIMKNQENEMLHKQILENIIKIIEQQGNKNKIEEFGKDEIEEVFSEIIPEFLQEFCNNSNKSFDIDNTESGESISISKSELELCIKNSVLFEMQQSQNIVNVLRNMIFSICSKYKIDSNKFCFDENVIKK